MAAVMNMQNDGGNALHPFFTRPNGNVPPGEAIIDRF